MSKVTDVNPSRQPMMTARGRLAFPSWLRVQFADLPIPALLTGILMRVILAPYTSWSNDVAVWLHTSIAGFYGLHLYDRPGFSYPPFWGYCLEGLGFLIRVAGGDSSFFYVVNPDFSGAAAATNDFSIAVTSPAFNLAFKSVLFLFDFVTALIVFRLVWLVTRDSRRARRALMLWFLNPYVIFESAVQGSPDVIVGFSVIATVALILLGRPLAAGAAWVIGIMSKVVPVILCLELVWAITLSRRSLNRSLRFRVMQVILLASGAGLALALLVMPEALFGSVQAIWFNTFHRTNQALVIGGLSVTGIRHFKQWSWLFVWGYQNSPIIVLLSTLAEVVAIGGWTLWTFIVVRRSAVFGLLTGVVGILATFMVLSPLGQPTYVIWWLPTLVVLVSLLGRGYWQVAFLSLAPLIFSIGVLGPSAYLAPLSTFTQLLPGPVVNSNVIAWYSAPGRLWGLTRQDDFVAPAALVTLATLAWMFGGWVRIAILRKEPQFRTPTQS